MLSSRIGGHSCLHCDSRWLLLPSYRWKDPLQHCPTSAMATSPRGMSSSVLKKGPICSMQLLLQHQAHTAGWTSIRMMRRLAVPTQERPRLLARVPICFSLNCNRRTLCRWKLQMIVPCMETTTCAPFQGLRLTKCKH